MFYVSGPIYLVESGLSVLKQSGYRIQYEKASACPTDLPLFNILDIIRIIRTEVADKDSTQIMLYVLE